MSEDKKVSVPPPPKSPADSSDTSWEKERMTTYEMDSFMGFLGQVPAKQRAALLEELASTVKGAGRPRTAPTRPPSHDPSSTFYCGTSFQNASETCRVPCPNGMKNECPDGMSCYSSTPCEEKGSFYCGLS